MENFIDYLIEDVKFKFNNWVKPTDEDIRHEYDIEYVKKGLGDLVDDAWPTFEDFHEAVKKAKVVKVTPQMDAMIQYRSGTRTQDELLNLIRGYRSYPKFRNEKTLQAIYDGFRNGKPMKMPLVLKWSNRKMRVLGGNTRMDVAFQLGVNPKVLMVEVP